MSLIDFMNTMQSVQLFDNGEYMVIYVDMDTYSDKQAHKYLYSKSEKFNVFLVMYKIKNEPTKNLTKGF